jgi:outer membrane protein OmpA-like peptidoglycan-associated protein
MTNTSRLALASAVLLAAACATPGERTAIGAGGGAAVGGAVGAVAGGWKGALIGAGVGAVAGGAVGNYLDKQAQELKQVAAETKRTRDGILVKLKSDLLFESGSAVLKPPAVEELSKLGDILAKYADDRVRIEGHTDSVGGVALNEELSLRRADAVKSVLVSRGVKENQLLSMGLGKANPVADNDTSHGRALNRRVELHIDVPQQGSGGD